MSLTRRELLGLGAIAALGGGVGLGSRLSADAVGATGPYGRLGPPDDDGVRVPAGFGVRVIGRTGERVPGTGYEWHRAPDGAGCFPTPDGGWIHVSNSEVTEGRGGVSAVVFDAAGEIVDAYSIASGTSRNCSGGATSRGTWLTCEEVESGRVYECDPTQPGDAVLRAGLGTFRHEAAVEDPTDGIVYLTEDRFDGRLYRFVPERRGDLDDGRLQAASVSGDRVRWVDVSPDVPARSDDTTVFMGGEGIVIDGRTLFVTTNGDDRIWELGLADGSIRVFVDGRANPSALSGVDQIVVHPHSRDLFVAEDGGDLELVQIVMDAAGRPRSIAPFLQFVGHEQSEVTGPAFSPDGSRLYVSSQRGSDGATGLTVEVTGPFESWPEVATVSGRWRAERIG